MRANQKTFNSNHAFTSLPLREKIWLIEYFKDLEGDPGEKGLEILMLHVYSWINMTLETNRPVLESLLVVLQSEKLFPYESNKNAAKKRKRKAGWTLKVSLSSITRWNPTIYVFLIMTQIFDALTSGWPLRSGCRNCDSVLEFLFCSHKGHHLLSRRKEGTSEASFYKPLTTMYTYVQQCSGLAGRVEVALLSTENAGELFPAVLSRHFLESKHRVWW